VWRSYISSRPPPSSRTRHGICTIFYAPPSQGDCIIVPTRPLAIHTSSYLPLRPSSSLLHFYNPLFLPRTSPRRAAVVEISVATIVQLGTSDRYNNNIIYVIIHAANSWRFCRIARITIILLILCRYTHARVIRTPSDGDDRLAIKGWWWSRKNESRRSKLNR